MALTPISGEIISQTLNDNFSSLQTEVTENKAETLTGVFNVVTGYGADPTGVEDSSTEIQAAIDAAETAGGGIVFFPPGTYLTSSALTVESSGIIIIGSGANVTSIINSTSDIFSLSDSLTAILYCGFEDLKLHSQAGGGHVFNIIKGCSMSRFKNLIIDQDNDAKNLIRCVRTATTGGMFNNVFSGGHWFHTPTATVPGVFVQGSSASSGNVCSDCVWTDMRVQNSGDYFFHIECDKASVFNYNNTFRNIESEVMESGLIKILSASGTTIDNVRLYDNATLTKSPFYLSQSTNGPQNQGTIFRNCGRTEGTLNASVYDIELAGSNDSAGTQIQEYTGPSGAAINLGSNEYVGLIGFFTNVTFTGFPTDRGFKLSPITGLDVFQITMAGGSAITGHFHASATQDVLSIAAQTCNEFIITVTGAAVGDTAYATPATIAGTPNGLVWSAIVSGVNTVTIRVCNVTASAIDPPETTWRVDVWKH